MDNILKKSIKQHILNDKPKNLGGRPSKKVQYKKEREKIINKLNNILGLNDNQNNFILYDIENDEKIVKSIIDLKDDIEKYFKGKSSAVFAPKNKPMTKPFLGLIKIVYKEMNYSIISTQKTISRNNKSFSSNIYIISKDDILKNDI